MCLSFQRRSMLNVSFRHFASVLLSIPYYDDDDSHAVIPCEFVLLITCRLTNITPTWALKCRALLCTQLLLRLYLRYARILTLLRPRLSPPLHLRFPRCLRLLSLAPPPHTFPVRPRSLHPLSTRHPVMKTSIVVLSLVLLLFFFFPNVCVLARCYIFVEHIIYY